LFGARRRYGRWHALLLRRGRGAWRGRWFRRGRRRRCRWRSRRRGARWRRRSGRSGMRRRCGSRRLRRGTRRRRHRRLRRGARRRRRGRRWRGPGWRCRRRRCGSRGGGTWRRCRCGGRCCGRRRTRRWLSRGRRALRRRLGFSVGTKLFLGLRHNHRRGLRVRCIACKLHCRQRSRGKQKETKSGHGGWDPRKKICNKLSRSTNKVRPDCGGLQRRTCFYSGHRKAQCVLVHCAFRRSFWPANRRSAHRWEKAYAALAVRAPAIHPACCPVARQAAAARRDPAGAAAPQAVDFPAGFPAAAPRAARA
jgi:hypothetical protein